MVGNTARLRKFEKPKTSQRRDISRLYILEITTKNHDSEQYCHPTQYCEGFAKKLNLVGWVERSETQHFQAFVGLRCAAPNLRIILNRAVLPPNLHRIVS